MLILGKVSWLFYIVGTALVFGSWINAVSAQTGWIGWIIGMIGWGLGLVHQKTKSEGVSELQRLAQLHQDGQLTDEEFSVAKRKIIG